MTAKTHETTISIKQRVPVKAIRIERDYSLGDGITRFQTEFPMELTGKVNGISTIITKCMCLIHFNYRLLQSNLLIQLQKSINSWIMQIDYHGESY